MKLGAPLVVALVLAPEFSIRAQATPMQPNSFTQTYSVNPGTAASSAHASMSGTVGGSTQMWASADGNTWTYVSISNPLEIFEVALAPRWSLSVSGAGALAEQSMRVYS